MKVLIALQNNDVMNISSNPTTINHLYTLISRKFKKETAPEYISRRRGDILFSTLENTKARRLLGWNSKYQLDEGIHEMIQTIKVVSKEDTYK